MATVYLSTRERFLLGGAGALTPILLNMLTVDFAMLMINASWVLFAGYAVRTLALFLVGGIVAYLNSDEHVRVRVFQLGIAAPALITGLINASHANGGPQAAAPPNHPLHSSLILPVAFAQDDAEIRLFTLPRESAAEQFKRGLAGGPPERVWFVIAENQTNPEAAKARARELTAILSKRGLNRSAQAYAPYGGNGVYRVVIGEHLLRQEAEEVRQRAVEIGLKDTYTWRLY